MNDDEALAEMAAGDSAAPEEVKTPAEAPESGETGEKAPESKEEYSARVQTRINNLTSEKYEFKRQADEARAEAKRLREQVAAQDKAPSMDDPGIDHDPEKFQEKTREYYQRNQVAAPTQQQESAPIDPDSIKRLEDFKRENPDYDGVVRPMLENGFLNVDVITAMAEVENGPAVAYHLAKRLDIADEINALSPTAAAIRIKTLSDSLTPAAPKTTTAPDPVPSETSGGGSIPKTDTSKMSMEQLEAYDQQRWEEKGRGF